MADGSNYWLRGRLSRRRALGGAGLGLSAVALAACGGNSSNNSNSAKPAANNSSGNAPKASATTLGLLPAAATATPTLAQAKPGGSLTFQVPNPPPSLDPFTQTSYLNSYQNGMTYSKLYRYKAGTPDVAPTDPTMEPDLAQAMPEIADPMTLTVKLKPAKWQNVAPVNGRDLTSDDIKYAIDRYQNYDKSVHKSFWLFLDSMQTPDKQTITFKLKFPYADFVAIAGGNLGAYISPKEFAETDAAATKMVGSGPFINTDYQTGTSLTYKKNPDYYDKPYPYLDSVTSLIVTDMAKREADFEAKSVDLTWLFLPPQPDAIKKNRPDAKSDEQQGISGYVYMRTDKPPFNDARVRQALSMAINRQAIRDAITSGQGVDDQAIFVGLTGIAKQVKDLGDSSKFWKYDPQAAKQLLTAAGADNLSFQWSHADPTAYGTQYTDTATLTQNQWKQIGVNATDNTQPYAQYISTTYQGNYDGVGHSPRAVPYYLDFVTDNFYWSSAGQRARINLSYVNDPQLNTLIDKQRSQFDLNERKTTITAIETIIAAQQYQIFYSTDTRTYFWNPALQNFRPTGFFPYTHLMKTWRNG